MAETKSDIYVIILAAGLATRLRPLSNRIPKLRYNKFLNCNHYSKNY